MSMHQLPAKSIMVDNFTVKAIAKFRSVLREKLEVDFNGQLFKSMNSGGMKETESFQTSSKLNLELTASVKVKSGEIFFDVENKRENRVLATGIPLIPTLVFRTPTYRENEELVYLRKFPESVRVSVMDDVDHELIYNCIDSKASVISIKNEPNSYYLVNTNAITHFQPLTHWPTRILLTSIAKELENLTDQSNANTDDDTDIATHRYLIDKALTTGNIDTVPINPINILKQVKTILESNRDNTKAQSLAVIIERYSEELETLEEKYQGVWPKLLDRTTFSPE